MLRLALLVRCALASKAWSTLANSVGPRSRTVGRFVRSAVLLKYTFRLRVPMPLLAQIQSPGRKGLLRSLLQPDVRIASCRPETRWTAELPLALPSKRARSAYSLVLS